MLMMRHFRMRAIKCPRTALPLLYPSSQNANRKKWHHIHSSAVTSYPRCELTSVRYNVDRGKFSQVCQEDIDFFINLLDRHRVVLEESDLEGHNTDWLGMVRGASSVLLKPRNTEEVSAVMNYCNQRTLAVCPQGGNTGLVGGSVPVFDEIIISTSLMNEVENVDKLSGVVTCQSGCVLETLDQHVAEYGLMIPLDLGAKGSCHIGGNVSTNAGGLRVVRYGGLHGSVLGVEAVLASGEVINCMSAMKKDNTGYDLKHLFIGSEGTLGIVTKVAISCPPRPKAVNLAFLGLQTFEDVLHTFREAKAKLGEILSSCEFIDRSSMECVELNLKLRAPIDPHPFYMLIETSGSNSDHDEEKLNMFLEESLGSGQVSDGTVATEPSRMLYIWSIRERIAEALIHEGYTYKYDISLPHKDFYRIVENMKDRLGDSVIRCCGYGHIGDGNLHLNIVSKEFQRDIVNLIEPTVFEWTAEVSGSISAEHGLGFKKRNYMHFSKSSNAIKLMKQMKMLMDPKGILNPYKVLPEM
ncbi:D-2-hydroxyglutarate dehydrogenase, mitochondrial [Palaemon carinicauda]|uniref:D-2-hydroxyglutarate dehydrogenase, mitochondrial n=1 Tax=Palaemon carinicauda TaxID=392227 RepID=UPI0035B582FB